MNQPPIRALKAGLSLLIPLTLSVGASAAQLETLAWTQTLLGSNSTVYLASLAQDSAGNSYSLYRVSSGSPGVVIGIRSYSKDGTERFSKSLITVNTDAIAGEVFVSPNTATGQYVYGSCRYKDAVGHWHAYYAKFSPTGVKQWAHVVSGGSGVAYPLSIDADSSGNAFLASASNSPSWHLILDKLSVNGTLSVHKTNFHIAPYVTAPKAYHVLGHWVVSGENTSVLNSSMWGVFSDSTGALQGARTFQDHNDATYSYHYSVWAQPYNNGVAALYNVQYTPLGGGTIHTKHLFSGFGYTGAATWPGEWKPGWVDTFEPGLNTNPIVAGGRSDVSSTGFITRLGSTGLTQWVKTLPSYLGTLFLTNDPTGFFVASVDTRAPVTPYLFRFDSSGTLNWTYKSPGGQITSLISDGDNTFLGTLRKGTPQGALVQRFVGGLALASIVPSKTTASSGQSVALTIHLNSLAASAQSITLHSTNPKLLFGNGTQNITVTVQANAGTTSTNVNVGAIASTQQGEIVAVLDGVRRGAYLTLTP